MTRPADGDRWLYAWSVAYGAAGAASVLVPLYAVGLGAGPFLVGVLAATAAFAGVPGAVLWGRLATRTGRRRGFVLGSMAATAAVLAVVPTIDALPALLVANAALWFAVAAAAPVLILLVVDGRSEATWDRRIALLNAYQGYGWLAGLLAGAAWTAVAAPVLGGHGALQAFFLASAAATAVGVALAWRWLPGRPSVAVRRFGRSTRTLSGLLTGAARRNGMVAVGPGVTYWALRRLHPGALRRRLSTALGAYLLAVGLSFTGFSTFFGPLPAYLAAAGLSTGGILACFLSSSAVSAVWYGRTGALAERYTPQRVHLGGLAGRVLLFPAVAVGASAGVGPLLVLFGAIGLTWALVAVTAAGIVTRLAPPAVRGDALGAYTALAGLGGGLGGLLGGWLAAAVGYLPTFAAAGGLVLLGVVVAGYGFRLEAPAGPGVRSAADAGTGER